MKRFIGSAINTSFMTGRYSAIPYGFIALFILCLAASGCYKKGESHRGDNDSDPFYLGDPRPQTETNDIETMASGDSETTADSDTNNISTTDIAIACEYNGAEYVPGERVPIATCEECDDSCICGDAGNLEDCTNCECRVDKCELDGETLVHREFAFTGDGCTECTCDYVTEDKMALFCEEILGCTPGVPPTEVPVFTETIAGECQPGTWIKGSDPETGQKECATCPLNSTSHASNASSCVPKRFIDIAVGAGPICGLYEDGSVQCWGGYSDFHSFDPPPSDPGYTSLSMGGISTCLLGKSKHLTCWGDPGMGLSSDFLAMSQVGQFERIYSHADYSCGLKADGTARCFGGTTISLMDFFPEPNLSYIDLALGASHLCGLGADGVVECDCFNDECRTPTEGSFQQIVAGQRFSCGLKTDGAAVCWEMFEDTYIEEKALEVPEDERFIQLAAVRDVVCGLSAEGDVTCWGDSSDGVHNGPKGENYIKIAVGYHNGCGLKDDGSVSCWGSDEYAALVIPNSHPVEKIWGSDHKTCMKYVDGEFACLPQDGEGEGDPADWDFVDMSMKSQFGCGIFTNGTARCWESSSQNSVIENWFPEDPIFKQIHVFSRDTVCGILDDGTVDCRGNGDALIFATPEGTDFVSLAMGTEFGCALRNNGTVACWGWAENGETNPPEGIIFSQIEASKHYACGATAIGTIHCWGKDGPLSLPAPPGEIKELAIKSDFPCVLLTDGTYHCWSATQQRYDQQPASALLSQVVHTQKGSCGIREYDGIITCWGKTFRNHWE